MSKMKMIVLAEDRDPWARQPRETDKAWEAFMAFRDMPLASRSISGAAAIVGRKSTQLRVWSEANMWRSRASAYDGHKDQIQRESDERLIKAMREKHIKIGQTITGLAMSELAKHIKHSREVDHPILSATTASVLAEKGLRIERLNRGEPESIHEEVNRLNMTWTELVSARNKQVG